LVAANIIAHSILIIIMMIVILMLVTMTFVFCQGIKVENVEVWMMALLVEQQRGQRVTMAMVDGGQDVLPVVASVLRQEVAPELALMMRVTIAIVIIIITDCLHGEGATGGGIDHGVEIEGTSPGAST
jgi:hypothetical protein